MHSLAVWASMQLSFVDGFIIGAVLLLSVLVGLWSSRRAGKDPGQFFLSGRGLSGWLLGISMVATSFAADTPGLVTQFVRDNGVAGNWEWWAFLLTGMLTVFLFSRLWRRSGLTTDLEFYEIRYSGRPALALRVFRAIYLGVVFNIIVMAIVSVAAIKIGQVMLGVSPIAVLLVGGVVTLVLSAVGGFRAVVLTDCLLFVVAIAGAVAAAYFALSHPSVGGLQGLMSNSAIEGKLDLVPQWDWSSDESFNLLASVLLFPLLVQWWANWYPGAEPGGGGYLAQRMLAAKNENHALGAVLLFNAVHYAVRPWPWILVALASLVVYPDLNDLAAEFSHVKDLKLGQDLAYPAMLTIAPSGWRGLILASLLAAYISTISTHLNWGASYVTGDFYQRVINPNASPRQLVFIGRLSTVVMMLLASLLALYIQSAKQGFDLLLKIGAGTGLIYILRWYWWRINAWSEIVAMAMSLIMAIALAMGAAGELESWQGLSIAIVCTTFAWLLTALCTAPEPMEKLVGFCQLVRPRGPGWRKVYQHAEEAGQPIEYAPGDPSIGLGVLRMLLGCAAVYAVLFAIGKGLYFEFTSCGILAAVAVVSALALVATFKLAPKEHQA